MSVPELREKIRQMEMEAFDRSDLREKALLEQFGSVLADEAERARDTESSCPWCHRVYDAWGA